MQQYEIFQLKLFGEEPADNYVDVKFKGIFFSKWKDCLCERFLYR